MHRTVFVSGRFKLAILSSPAGAILGSLKQWYSTTSGAFVGSLGITLEEALQSLSGITLPGLFRSP